MNPDHPHTEHSSAPPTLATRIRSILEASPTPLELSKIKTQVLKSYPKGTKKAPQPPQPTEAEIQAVLDSSSIYRYPPGTARGKAKYWHKPPLTAQELARQTVLTKLTDLGDGPFKPTKLGKPTAAKGPEASRAFQAAIDELIAEKKLFVYPGGEYGKKEPPKPKWYQQPPHQAEFKKVEGAAKKLQEQGVSMEQIMTALRERFGLVEVGATPPSPIEEKPKPPPLIVKDLRTILKEAYDHLCKFPDFRDRLVDLPSLYHEAAERFPGLTPEAFHRELWQMRTEWVIELHDLNEVHLAKEPHLAIHRDDSLYYFARWK